MFITSPHSLAPPLSLLFKFKKKLRSFESGLSTLKSYRPQSARSTRSPPRSWVLPREPLLGRLYLSHALAEPLRELAYLCPRLWLPTASSSQKGTPQVSRPHPHSPKSHFPFHTSLATFQPLRTHLKLNFQFNNCLQHSV